MTLTKLFKKLRYKPYGGFMVALFLHKIYIFYKFRIWSDEYYISKDFKQDFGYELNLQNPQTLNEKINWYKLNYKNPLISICADKYAVPEYVANCIGSKYLISLVFHTDNYKRILPENLPDYPFIIKANHTAGTHHIVRDKSKADWKRIQTDCRWWLHSNYFHIQKEWQYEKIKPKIIVEKLLTDENGQIPSDYKLHYFEGKFGFLQVDLNRFTQHKRNLYDKDWNLLPFTWSLLDSNGLPYKDNGRQVPRPINLASMIDLGTKLAKSFPYVRVDFYIINEEIFFGELTLHHGGGLEHFTPSEWDFHFGRKVPLRMFDQ